MTQLRTDHGDQHVNPHHLGELYPTQHTRPIRTEAVFGTVFFEVILSADTLPTLPGWTLRLWPQARLGDATLEAAPDQPGQRQDINGLLRGLQAQGIQALGPVHLKRT